jgi:hypothetical protein
VLYPGETTAIDIRAQYLFAMRSHDLPTRATRPEAAASAAASPRQQRVLALQRAAGNRATRRLLRRGGTLVDPVPFTPASVIPYTGTTIRIAPGENDPMGTFRMKVVEALWQIEERMGSDFLRAVSAPGRTVMITQSNGNSCAGLPPGHACVRLRHKHESDDETGFAEELNFTIDYLLPGGRDADWIAAQLAVVPLPDWFNLQSVGTFADAAQAGTALQAWMNGERLPEHDEMDLLMLVLARYVRPGPGCNSKITWNPDLTTATYPRPPAVALCHELVHAMYNAQGRQLGREDSTSEFRGGRLFEIMAVGLQPYHTARYSENAARGAFGVGPRTAY